MNKPDLFETIKRSEWAIPAGILAFGVLFVILFCVMVTLPKFLELKKYQQEYNAQSERLAQYKNLKTFTSTLIAQKQKINTLMANPDINTGKSTDTLAGISELAVSAGIKFDNVNAVTVNGENSQAWNIAFSADTRQLVNFLAIAERNYKVKTMSADCKDNAVPHVTLTISDIASGAEKNFLNEPKIDTGGDLYDLGQKAVMHANQIQKAALERSVAVINRDIFSNRIIESTSAVKKPIIKKVYIPPIHLEHISWDPFTPVAVIEGMVLKEGDTYREIHVVKINRKSVHVKWRDNDVTLKLHKKKETD